MRLIVCAVLDSRVGAYAQVMQFRSKGEAIRSFESACRDDKSPMHMYPADFSLWQLGLFDDNDGSLRPELERLIGAGEFG